MRAWWQTSGGDRAVRLLDILGGAWGGRLPAGSRRVALGQLGQCVYAVEPLSSGADRAAQS